MKKVALVTGGNRGLGFETSRQLGKRGYHVVLTSRDERKGAEAATKLRDEGLAVSHLGLDVTREESVSAAVARVRQEFGRIDALVNNAGILIDAIDAPDARDATPADAAADAESTTHYAGDADVPGTSALRFPVQKIRETLETNLFGAYRMCQAFAPLLLETAGKPDGFPRIVNLSSGMGQLSEMNGGYPAYRISKTALNAVTRIFSEELGERSHRRVLVNSVCPGWVKTDMGGAEAELTPAEGADTITWAATLPEDGPTGGFFRDRERIEW